MQKKRDSLAFKTPTQYLLLLESIQLPGELQSISMADLKSDQGSAHLGALIESLLLSDKPQSRRLQWNKYYYMLPFRLILLLLLP